MNVGLIVAAGTSSRFGGPNKQFARLSGRPLLWYSVMAFAQASAVDRLVIVTKEDDFQRCRREIVEPAAVEKPVSLVAGGSTRQGSVARGLAACPVETELIWVHDGARPLITAAQIDDMACRCAGFDGLILAAPVTDTIKRVEHGIIQDTPDRNVLWQAQTPQLFRFQVLCRVHKTAAAEGIKATDDSALVQQAGYTVAVLLNESKNLKVTTATDLLLAEAVLKRRVEE